MPEPIPSCFRGSIAGVPPASTAVGPSLATSIYDTHLGLASFSWSRTVLGLSLRADLRLSPSSFDDDDDNEDEPFFFRIRPWFFWKRKGSRRFHPNHRVIDVSWDLTRARFPSTGGPEPSSDFFVAVAIDGDMLLVAGDMEEEAHRKMKVKRRTPATPISRKEHVLLKQDTGGKRSYCTAARVLGKERQIAIEIGGKGKEKEKESSGMCVAVDGMKVLQVRRLRWKFRGRERVEIDGGGRIQISWDLHSWLFPSKEDTTPASHAGEIAQAVFVFRFESEETEKRGDAISVQNEKVFASEGNGGLCKGLISGYLGKNRDWSESSNGVDQRLKAKKKSLLKTSSSSSSSSASSAGSSSVMDWASLEEVELRGVDGFTLVVYAWKS